MAFDEMKVSAKIEGEIGDLLAKLAAAQAAVKAFKKEAQGKVQMNIARDMKNELDRAAAVMKSGIIRKAAQDMFKADDIAAREGESSAKAFARAWRTQMKKERYRTPGWLPWVGAGMLAAPPVIAGLAGVIGGLATAGFGAAAGLGALALSAKEILGPVNQAFQSIDKLTTSGQTLANATALQQWIGGTTTKSRTSSAFNAASIGQRIAAEQLRIQGTSARIAAATTPSSRLAAQATLITQRNVLSGLQQQLSAGGTTTTTTTNALPPGFGFLTRPNVNWYTMTAAQRQRTVAMAQTPMTGQPTAFKSQVNALMQERQAFVGLDAAQRQALYSRMMFDQALVHAQKQSQPIVMKLYAQGLRILTPLLKYLHPLAQAAGMALSGIFTQIQKLTQSRAFGAFMDQLTKMAGVGVKGFGTALVNIATGLMHVFTAFSKSGLPQFMMKTLDDMTKHFATWTAGKGFHDFMEQMKQDAPVVMKILRELMGILGNLLKSMAGGLGTAELKAFAYFLQLLNWAASIPGIGPFIYNMIALTLLFSKFGTLKAATALWDIAYKTLGKLVGLKFTGWIANLLKIETEGKKMGDIWKAIGGKVWGFAVTFGKALGSSLKAVYVWSMEMLARMGATVAGWVAGWLGLDIATEVGSAAAIAASGGILLGIGLLIIGIYELVKHWKTVWKWIKQISKDAWDFIWNGWGKYLLPLLGPAGLMVLGLIMVWKHWSAILKWIKNAWDSTWGEVKKLFAESIKTIVDDFLWFVKTFVHGAAVAFGWLPGVGSKLKQADKWVQNFSKNVDSYLNKLEHPRTVNLDFALHLPPGISAYKAVQSRDRGAGGFATFHARGTTGASPGWSWVGEQGPELVRFTGGEPVLSHSQSMNASPAIGGGGRGYAAGTPGNEFVIQALRTGSSNKNVFGGMAIDENAFIKWYETFLVKQIQKKFAGGGSAILAYASKFAHKVPYVWGGTTPAGWDCSGFTSYVYHHFGIPAPRTSQEQQAWARKGSNIPGALIFFYGTGGSAQHVGFATGGPTYLGADDPALGTTYQPIAGNSGFGIPPMGLTGVWSGRGGTVIELGRSMAANYGWTGRQWTDLYMLWNRESGWNPYARNPTSGAAGIPQDITGNFHGGAAGQIAWGLNYIFGRYRSPANAWAHEVSQGWYDRGGWARPGYTGMWNTSGQPERVLNPAETRAYMAGRSGRSSQPVVVNVYTSEIHPQYHAARLGFELARRIG